MVIVTAPLNWITIIYSSSAYLCIMPQATSVYSNVTYFQRYFMQQKHLKAKSPGYAAKVWMSMFFDVV